MRLKDKRLRSLVSQHMLSPFRNETLDLHKKLLTLRFVNRGDTVIDAGAYQGYYSKFYAKVVGTAGKVFAYEAHPAIYKEASNRLANFPQVELIHAAVSNTSGVPITLTCNPDDIDAECSTVETDLLNMRTGSSCPKGAVAVLTRKIDDRSLMDCALLKLDVEGHESAVIEGAKECLQRCNPIVIMEYSYSPNDPEMTQIQQLEDLGYVVFDGRTLQRVRPGYQASVTDLFGIPKKKESEFEKDFAQVLLDSASKTWSIISNIAFRLGRK